VLADPTPDAEGDTAVAADEPAVPAAPGTAVPEVPVGAGIAGGVALGGTALPAALGGAEGLLVVGG
jgi:hypothetical protein